MPPRRKEKSDENKEIDSKPELEEPQAADDNQQGIFVQGMVDCIEGQSHGQPVAKQPVVLHGHTPDKNVADLEEASKVMAEGILAYLKAVVGHITQSKNQGNFQHKEPEQGLGSLEQRSPANVRWNGNGNPRPHLHQLYNVTNPVNQSGLYEEGTSFPIGSTGINADNGAYQALGARFYNHPLQNMNTSIIDLDLVRETVQELYGPALRLIGRPEFYKPYPEVIDHNNPYPRDYKISDFSLFTGEDSILTWQDMERQLHTHLYRTEPEVCIADLSRISQNKGEFVDMFVDRIKKMKNRCKVLLQKGELVKMAQKRLDFELRKKFQWMEFKDFFEICSKVAEYEDFLKEESYKKKTMLSSYYQDIEEVALAETVLPDRRVPSKEEIKGREYCKYHDSYNHNTKSCLAFKNVMQERINKGVLKFPEKQDSMTIHEDPFPPVASINMNTKYLREFLNDRHERPVMNEKRVRTYWIPKEQMFEAHKNSGRSTARHIQMGSPGNVGGYTATRSQYFSRKMKETHHSHDMDHRSPREFQKAEDYYPRFLPTKISKEHDYRKKHEPIGKAQ
ncbi:hypothetical protein F511_35155 [Dorcoceras hygrometricum]|uniref:Retrotransposon gag domain-containing protein n=1 Tax=Dorcoceras hygrometricum TaxID=472368 RepID=A0A2Z7DI39_9LAMI|nr:hypothetical protein F511_35155 [Dorcoceras hygrometricum]